MIKYEELSYAGWTNYYIPIPDSEVPVFYTETDRFGNKLKEGEKDIVFTPTNVLILGKTGSVSVTDDLDLFLLDVESILTFNLEETRWNDLKVHPKLNFSPEEIVAWLINNYKDDYIVSRLKLGKYGFLKEQNSSTILSNP